MKDDILEIFLTKLLNKTILIDIFEDGRTSLINDKTEDKMFDILEKIEVNDRENPDIQKLRYISITNQAKLNIKRTLLEIKSNYGLELVIDPNFENVLRDFYKYLDKEMDYKQDVIRIYDPIEVKKNGFKYIENASNPVVQELVRNLKLKA